MQKHMIADYIKMIYQYDTLMHTLYHHLMPHLHLTRIARSDIDFIPSERSITTQIQRWPTTLFLYPPVAWITPRTGTFQHESQSWSFAFHGAGLSFFHESTNLDVSGEFSRTGTFAFTMHTVVCYLTTHPLWSTRAIADRAIHEWCFHILEERTIITAIPPLWDAEEQTYCIDSPPEERQAVFSDTIQYHT